MTYFPNMITGRQIRMARAGLGWSIDRLATEARVNKNTILRLEKDLVDTRKSSIEAVQRALEDGGVQFIEDGVVFKSQSQGAHLMTDDPVLAAIIEADMRGALRIFALRLWRWLEESSQDAASAKDILDAGYPDGALGSAIDEILPTTRDGVKDRTPESLAKALSHVKGRPFIFEGDAYRFGAEGDHEGDPLVTRWTFVRVRSAL